MNDTKEEKDSSIIPKGMYCYQVLSYPSAENNFKYNIKPCQYWSLRKDKLYQMNGYCSFIERGDWDLLTSFELLWDQVKVCGINDEDFNEKGE